MLCFDWVGFVVRRNRLEGGREGGGREGGGEREGGGKGRMEEGGKGGDKWRKVR